MKKKKTNYKQLSLFTLAYDPETRCSHFLNFSKMWFLYSLNDGLEHYELHEFKGNGKEGNDFSSTDKVIGYFDSLDEIFDFIWEWKRINNVDDDYKGSSNNDN